MARIRTIKPSFFRHELLYELEHKTKLPLRIAFAGLWTTADREGRFVWRPRELKLDCLPFDEVDFAEVLKVLADADLIRRYEVDGKVFGYIPSWHVHQCINHREALSTLPAPDTGMPVHARASNMHAREKPVHASGEGKGREGKGRERKAREKEYFFESGSIRLVKRDFDKWKDAFSYIDLKAELVVLTPWADAQGDRWFHAVQNALAKRNRLIKAEHDKPVQSRSPAASHGIV